jgi:exodeoxyribonuclease VII large subunit
MKNVYSVGQVNKYIKDMFAQDFMLHRISIKGEVSNCKYHSSGHIYFTIKDAEAAISAVMFAGARKEGLRFPMKEGDKVIVTGSVEVYERDGRYQIYAKTIEQDGEGDLYRKFEALKQELEEMGMFDPAYKRPIPEYAQTIGIVTSPTGAVIRDIQNVAGRRNPYVQLILYPALVQGEGAAQTIVNGIHALEEQDVDVIIVGRGGGSIEDLWAFNEEIVARAIFDSTVPIISAVGHETDFTIADFVADLRAPTPSAAAELAVYDYRQTRQELLAWQEQLGKAMQRKVDLARARLDQQKLRLGYLSPQNRLNEKRRQVLDYEERLEASMRTQLVEAKHRLELLAARLDGASPLKKLSGGYAYVEDEKGEALRSVAQAKPEDSVRIHLMDGALETTVKNVVKGNAATELELGS